MILLPKPEKEFINTKKKWKPEKSLEKELLNVHFGEKQFKYIKIKKTNLREQSYRLSAGKNFVVIYSGGKKGTWNALMTLRQIMRQKDTEGYLPEIEIEDSPAFPNRGVMLDISRNRVPSISVLKELIVLFSELKFNQLQLYTEHTFAYKGHEKVWSNASPYTGEEIEEIDSYCAGKGIELIPNQNSFGHMERWLRWPEYHNIAEAPEGYEDPWGVYREYSSTLDPSSPDSLNFLKDLYDQLLVHFKSRNFNIGGDETYDLGTGKSRELCEEKGKGKVYVDFLNKIIREVKKRDYTPQFWADIILNYPELLKELPKDVTVMNWGYEDDHPFREETKAIADAGFEFYVCPGTSSWNSIAGRWNNALENIRNAAEHGLENGASGLLITDWGDNGYKQQYVVSVPGWFAAAAAAWNGPEGIKENIEEALQVHFFKSPGESHASLLLKLGNIYLENPVKLHNMSFIMLPLIDHEYPYYREQYIEIKKAGMGKAAETAAAVQKEISETVTSTDSIWLNQLYFTSVLTEFAVDLSEAFYNSEDFSIENIPENKRIELSGRLKKIMDEFRRLWLSYCREGGLEESIESFKGLYELLSL